MNEDNIMCDAIREARRRGESEMFHAPNDFMKNIIVPVSVFEGALKYANRLAYRPSPRVLSEDSAITVPYSVFEEGIKRANEKAYKPSKGLEEKR